MWYEHIIPKKFYFLGKHHWRWLNVLFIVLPEKLVWEKKTDDNPNNWQAFALGMNVPYVVGPSEQHTGQYCFYGPGLPFGYRMTIDAARRACEQHYQRVALGMQGILKKY